MSEITIREFEDSYRSPQPLVVDKGAAEIVILQTKHTRACWKSVGGLLLTAVIACVVTALANSWFVVLVGLFTLKWHFETQREDFKNRRKVLKSLQIKSLSASRRTES